VVVVVAIAPASSTAVDLGSGVLLASAGLVYLGAAPSVSCCCWHCWPECCWPGHCSGCSLCSPSKRFLDKRYIHILELN
jgi:hypothetical protein